MCRSFESGIAPVISGRLRLFRNTVPRVSNVANEEHSDDIRSLHTENRFQAVGISTHSSQNQIFTGPDSVNCPEWKVERLR